MKGHIRQRGKNTWPIVVELARDPMTGKRRQQWHTVKGTKRDAERELTEVLHSLEMGSFIKPSRITVGEYLSQWAETYGVMHTSPRTCEGYKSIVHHHLLPALGTMPLRQLQPQQIENYYASALTNGRVNGRGA